MANWREIKDNFKVDQLLGLNLKLLKDVDLYYQPLNPDPIKWDGWKLRAGQVTGKLYSWVSNVPANQNYPPLDIDGVWLMFFLDDIWDFTNPDQKVYYIKITPKMFDWEYTKTLLDAQRRSNMNWYENILEDFDTALNDYYNNLKDTVNDALWVGGILAAGILYWGTIGKYQVQARFIKSNIKDLIKEVKS